MKQAPEPDGTFLAYWSKVHSGESAPKHTYPTVSQGLRVEYV